jgi:uncharacterized protein YbjQ (UPF0145 family)
MFTAGLEAGGLAAAEVAGLRPIEQVMGACVLRTQFYGSAQALGVARRRALRRMENDARKREADAVACVQVTHTERAAGESAERDGVIVEAVATGMAVALPGRPSPPGDPVLTNMTIQECWKLARGGYAPAGIVMSTIADAGSLGGTSAEGGESVAGTNYEYADVSAMFRAAYRRAAQDMRKEAFALGAEGVIAAQIDRRTKWAGLYVRIILTVIGTAIASVRDNREAGPEVGWPRLRITPVRHADDPASPGTRPSAFS